MKYLAAYLLASLSGSQPDASTVEKVLSSVGAEVDSERLQKLVSDLDGKDLSALVAEGSQKLASMPSVAVGGGAAPAAAAAGGAAPAKEEKKEEAAEESDDDMGFGLFD